MLGFLVGTSYQKEPPFDEASPTKATWLSSLLALIFTVIQAKATVPATVRNAQVESIFTLFTLDGLAFKHVLTTSLSVPEKALVENVLRTLSASRQSQQASQGKANTNPMTASEAKLGSI